MNSKLTMLFGVGAALALASDANAQAETSEAKPLETPTKALEIYGGAGYTQGFGSLQAGVDMKQVITPGIATDVGVGYRVDPHWAVGLTGQYAEFDAQRANSARGAIFGAAVAYHIRPFEKWDPWVQLGTGYRFLWENNVAPTPDLLTHGFELARLLVGLDSRVSRDIAMGPAVGVDITLPLWQAVNGGTSTALNDPRVSTFVFAGLSARFDVGGRFVGGEKPPVVTVTQAAVCPPAPAPPPAKPVSPSLAASDEVLEACKMNLDNVDTAPKFDFDKSVLLPADMDVLAKVAECFSTGPLKGDRMLLVGRADPRGTREYNDALGMRRADTVATYMEQHGIDGARIERTSRGKDDATGTDEATWATDRRVDMLRVEIRVSRR